MTGLRLTGVATLVLSLASSASAYPLDAAERTGIARLEAQTLAVAGEVRGHVPPAGGRLPNEAIRLRLLERPELELPPPDPELGAKLAALLGAERPRYGLALLDLSDPEQPRYAESRATTIFNPGSVGKIVVAHALLAALAEAHPDDLAARERVLRETRVLADAFIRHDSHEVALWAPGEPRIRKRPLREGDAANLWSWLDWMVSASSNAAAAGVMKHLLWLRHFGERYPPALAEGDAWLAQTRPAELAEMLREALDAPLSSAGLDTEALRQGGFFTREGKRRVPAGGSRASARELLRWLLRMEQGRLVDPWSSLELKRLLYSTERRIRYASSPALADAAAYFKSGSLYRCRPEPDFVCRKYHGNVENVMNSVAIVEWPAEAPRLHYLVALTSNVLRRNSAVEHQTLATRIHRLMQAAHPEPKASPTPEPPPDSEAAPRR